MDFYKAIELIYSDQATTMNITYTVLCSDARSEEGHALNNASFSCLHTVFRKVAPTFVNSF